MSVEVAFLESVMRAAPAVDREPDFRALFENAPGLYLVLDPDFTVVAANDAWCQATLTARENILGRNLFDIFLDTSESDAPADATAGGIAHLRESLMAVLEHRCAHRMAIERVDVTDEGGGHEEHYWSALNTPVVDDTGEVRWIIHSFEDLTETMRACKDEITRRTFAQEDRHKVDRSGRPFALSVTGTPGWGSFP